MTDKKINTHNRKQILDNIKYILEPWAGDNMNLKKINQNTDLLSDLGMDSVGILQMILEIEQKYNIKINEQELDSNLTAKIGNFINLIERKLNETH